MGDNHSKYMDSDTVSGVQFGYVKFIHPIMSWLLLSIIAHSIGAVHLVLSALPAKILKAIQVLGWKPDKELGFSLLKECAENKRIRAPMATVM